VSVGSPAKRVLLHHRWPLHHWLFGQRSPSPSLRDGEVLNLNPQKKLGHDVRGDDEAAFTALALTP
jgi:hypothetical protein